MMATLTAYDAEGRISHHDKRYYPTLSLLWEHVGCQQNNRNTVRVVVATEAGLDLEVKFSSWIPRRRYVPSSRFHDLLNEWCETNVRKQTSLEGIA